MYTELYGFDLKAIDGSTKQVYFIGRSKQVAWCQAAAYVAAHTLNPTIHTIRHHSTARIVDVAIEEGEISLVEAMACIRL